jgi:hypothetical protein
MKDARYTKAKDVKVGDTVSFVEIPYYVEDLRMSFFESKVTKIEPTKSGKRVVVHFNNYPCSKTMSENTVLQSSPESFWNKMTSERGWK